VQAASSDKTDTPTDMKRRFSSWCRLFRLSWNCQLIDKANKRCNSYLVKIYDMIYYWASSLIVANVR